MTGPGEATVRGLLDAQLREPRVRSLETEVARLAALPLDQVVTDLRAELATRITGGDRQRLHVLVSTLYHRGGAGLDLTRTLYAEIEGSAHRHTEGGR